MKEHLIWAYHLRGGFMQFLISTILIIGISDLLSLLNCIVDQLNVAKQCLIFRLVPVIHRMNILYMRFKVPACKTAELAYQIL